MFTEQMVQLNALRGKAPDELLDAFQSLLGQCAAQLDHRGPVEIDVHPSRFDEADCRDVAEEALPAALTVKAYAGSYTRDPDQVGEGVFCGPAAIYCRGPVVAMPAEGDNFSFIGKCADIECVYGDNADFISIDVEDMVVNETISAPTSRWAVAQQAWKSNGGVPSQGGGMATVSCKFCDDAAGTNPTGAAFDVLLPVASGRDPNVVTGQVISIQQAKDGRWFSESGSDEAINMVCFWAGDDDPPPGWQEIGDVDDTWFAAQDEASVDGGERTHSHAGHTDEEYAYNSIDDHFVAEYTTESLADLAIEDHFGYTDSATTGIGVIGLPTDGAYTVQHQHWHDFAATYDARSMNLNPRSAGLASAVSRELDFGELTHTVNDEGHYHYFTLTHYVNDPGHRHYFQTYLEHNFGLGHAMAEHVPPYVRLRAIMRYNNSAP